MADITLTRGASEDFDLVAKLNGVPQSLSNVFLWFTVKMSTRDSDASAVFQKTLLDGIFVTNEAGGAFTVNIDAADTALLPDSSLRVRPYYDVMAEDFFGVRSPVVSGRVTVKNSVTRSIAP